MSVLVLGVGNILLSDEGVGVRLVEALQQKYHFPDDVELVDGGTAGMELLEFLANKQHVVIIDAVLTGGEAGAIIVLKDEQVPMLFNNKISPHQLGLSDLLSALKFTGESPNGLTLVGIVPETVEPKVGLSTTILEQLPKLEQLVLAALAEVDVKVSAKQLCV